MDNKHLIEEKWKKDEPQLTRIQNAELDCKNCKFRYDDIEVLRNTSFCEKFPALKPKDVFLGGKCKEKEVE